MSRLYTLPDAIRHAATHTDMSIDEVTYDLTACYEKELVQKLITISHGFMGKTCCLALSRLCDNGTRLSLEILSPYTTVWVDVFDIPSALSMVSYIFENFGSCTIALRLTCEGYYSEKYVQSRITEKNEETEDFFILVDQFLSDQSILVLQIQKRQHNLEQKGEG